MQKLIFRSIDSVVDTDELQRHAFNEAFRKNHLDWYWSRSQFMQLSLIKGERHRVRWYAETIHYPPLPMGLADKICWLKDRLIEESLSCKNLPLRPGIERLWREAEHEAIPIELQTTPREQRAWLDTINHSYRERFASIHAIAKEQTFDQSRLTKTSSKTLYDTGTNTVVISPCRGIPNQTSANSSRLERNTVIATQTGQKNIKAYIDHLGDVSNPATQLSGKRVVKDGLVSINSLSELEAV